MNTYIIAKCAMSLDGYIDDASQRRLALSGPEDRNAVDELRATCDAILIGAGTLRLDNPTLGVRRDDLRQKRVAAGLPAEPARIIITRTGQLPLDARFFAEGSGQRIVLTTPRIDETMHTALRKVADVHLLDTDEPSPAAIADELSKLGLRRVLIEGGSSILTQFVADNVADELRVAVAPFFVGDERSPRAFGPAAYRHRPGNRMRLVSATALGDMAVLTYLPGRES